MCKTGKAEHELRVCHELIQRGPTGAQHWLVLDGLSNKKPGRVTVNGEVIQEFWA